MIPSKKRKQSSISDFLIKKRVVSEDDSDSGKSNVVRPNIKQETAGTDVPSTHSSLSERINDIGNKVCSPFISDEERYEYLTNCWVPDQRYTFPEDNESKKKRTFQPHWLSQYKWLAYSEKLKGAVCKLCVVFPPVTVGKGSHQKPMKLVTEPLQKWKHALEYFSKHSCNEYHKAAVEKSSLFIQSYIKKENIRDKLDSVRLQQKRQNRER